MRKRKWDEKRGKELREQGLTYKEIAKTINLEAGNAQDSLIHYTVVYQALNPAQAQSKRNKLTSNQQAIKQKNVDHKGGSCQMTGDEFPGGKCGYNKYLGALSFHHLIQEDKSFAISNGRHLPWSAVEAELRKCIMLCANCHSEVHGGKHVEAMKVFIQEYKENIRPFLTPEQLVKGSPAARGNSILPKVGFRDGKVIVEAATPRKDLVLNDAGTAFCNLSERIKARAHYDKDAGINFSPQAAASCSELDWKDISYEYNQHEEIPR